MSRVLACLALVGLLSAGEPDDIVFPPWAGVFDVVRDGGLDNSGATDVSDALQAIFDARGRSLQIVYFPRGTYLLGKGVHLKIDRTRADTSHSHGPYLVGQSRTGTVFRLKDGLWPRPLMPMPPPLGLKGKEGEVYRKLDEQVALSTGDCTNVTFNKVLRNFTVSIGKGNAGAVGLMYNTSNTGCLSDVRIVSEDGQGHIGLALAGSENGPGQIRRIEIEGFGTGIHCVSSYVIACSQVRMRRIGRQGIFNRGLMACEDFRLDLEASDLPAVQSNGHGLFTMVGMTITGRSPRLAIEGDAGLYLREVETTGFAGAVAAGAHRVDEHLAGGPSAGLFHPPTGSLRLPIRHEPAIPWEQDFAKWCSPAEFGATGDGVADDTEAVQRALSAPGRTTVFFPFARGAKKAEGDQPAQPARHRYQVTRDLVVGPEVERIAGGIGHLSSAGQPEVRLRFATGGRPVIIEMMAPLPPLLVDNDRTVVVSSSRPGFKVVGLHLRGEGEVFVNDCHVKTEIRNPRQRVWFRHYNAEGDAIPMVVEAGQAWLLGWKSENLKQRVRVGPEGVLELFAFQNYEVGKSPDGPWPIVEVEGGRFALCGLRQHGTRGNANLVRETRGGETRTLTQQANGSKQLAFYGGFPPAAP